MKVKSITILLEPDDKAAGHATVLVYKDGMWLTKGNDDEPAPAFPRIMRVLGEMVYSLEGSK
jgi:hypothetical protein